MFRNRQLVRYRIKYRYQGNNSGYLTSGTHFEVGFPAGQNPLVLLENESDTSGGKD